jgi:acyl dehydratase
MPLQAGALKVGDRCESVVVKDLKRVQMVQYAGVSGDYNPIHTDEIYATKVAGYPTVFAHGWLTMGMTSRAVTDYVGDGRLERFGGRFTSQVWPGDTLTTRCVVTNLLENETGHLVELEVVTSNQDDQVVFSGYATARIDP